MHSGMSRGSKEVRAITDISYTIAQIFAEKGCLLQDDERKKNLNKGRCTVAKANKHAPERGRRVFWRRATTPMAVSNGSE